LLLIIITGKTAVGRESRLGREIRASATVSKPIIHWYGQYLLLSPLVNINVKV